MPTSLSARFWYFLLRATLKSRKQTVEQSRAWNAQNAHWMNRLPRGVNLERFSVEHIPAAWFRSNRAIPGRVILYLHGGGYVVGNIDDYKMICGQMADILKTDLLLLEYRLAPEHPFPAALEDAQMAYRWLLEQGYRPENIVIAGDSAGGGLSLATVLALREAGTALPAAVVCLSPWADLTLQGQSHQSKAKSEVMLTSKMLREWAGFYAGTENLSIPLISPAYADFRGFPPLLIQVGSEEILLDDARMVTEKARAAGADVNLKIWQGMWHVWQILSEFVPESKAAIEEIRRFIESKTHQETGNGKL
jgi:acetyl esterase/lipase